MLLLYDHRATQSGSSYLYYLYMSANTEPGRIAARSGFKLAALLLATQLMCVLVAAPSLAQTPDEDTRSPNGLALTPPMGWNSWNKFGCNIDENLIRKEADALVSSGMRDAGYQYVVIDDCWQSSRDAKGNIVADPQRFSGGMQALADYVHERGLKFGLYSDAGTKTCAGRPGSRGYEYQDARQYAAWGVDYLKYDWCHTGSQNAHASYLVMSDALRATGRPIVFSLCEWGTSKPWTWARDIGNLWRSTGDIADSWEGKRDYRLGVVTILDLVAELAPYAGPGHWNDPDMLEVGNGGMTDTEYRAHFSLWAILAAPLIAGNDMSTMNPATRAILTNREVIAIDQDPLGDQGRRVAKRAGQEVWARNLKGGSRAVVLLNRAEQPQTVTVDWESLGYPAGLSARIRDLWTGADLPKARGQFAAPVASHGVVMILIRP
jgi:alpha-galactosidase